MKPPRSCGISKGSKERLLTTTLSVHQDREWSLGSSHSPRLVSRAAGHSRRAGPLEPDRRPPDRKSSGRTTPGSAPFAWARSSRRERRSHPCLKPVLLIRQHDPRVVNFICQIPLGSFDVTRLRRRSGLMSVVRISKLTLLRSFSSSSSSLRRLVLTHTQKPLTG
jgi:hypothetical protein